MKTKKLRIGLATFWLLSPLTFLDSSQLALSASPYLIDFSNIGPAKTPTEANQQFAARAKVIIDYEACRGKQLGEIYKDEDDFVNNAIARLERGGTCPGENKDNITQVREALLRSQVRSKTGTDSPFPCLRTGDYDVALKGLITIMYRYRDKLDDPKDPNKPVYNHVLHDLLNRWGKYNFEDELTVGRCFGLVVPETENHLLMIETSRYLTNQLRFAEAKSKGQDTSQYDNETLGMNAAILKHLQQFLKNDFAEYNARPYQRYSIAAIQNLYDFAEDSRVKLAAQMVLDYVSAKFAVSSNNLRRAAPFRRLKDAKDITELFGEKSDPQTSRFIILSGLTQRLAEVRPPLHAHSINSANILLAAVGTYRVPDMILDLVMDKSHNSYYQRIYHGVRERKDIPGGVEVYSSESPFLITGGGIWMESGMGPDSLIAPSDAYKDTGWALPTTLMPTAAGIDRADFIRINGNLNEDHDRINTCVAPSFACGLNPFIPPTYFYTPINVHPQVIDPIGGRPIGSTESIHCFAMQGHWTFIDASDRCNRHLQKSDFSSGSARDSTSFSEMSNGQHKLGFYVAVYSSPCVTSECKAAANADGGGSFGFFEATPSEKLDFDTFRNGVLSRNGAFNYQSEGINEYVTVKGEKIRFIINNYKLVQNTTHSREIVSGYKGNKYQWGIVAINNKTFDTDIKHWPLAEGDIINSDGHSGLVTIDNPFLGQRLVLDMRDPLNPRRSIEGSPRRSLDASPAPLPALLYLLE